MFGVQLGEHQKKSYHISLCSLEPLNPLHAVSLNFVHTPNPLIHDIPEALDFQAEISHMTKLGSKYLRGRLTRNS